MSKQLLGQVLLGVLSCTAGCGLATEAPARNGAVTGGETGDPNTDVTPPTPGPQPTGPTLASATQLSAAEGGPYYMGRFNTTDPNGATFAWPGSSIFARFTGTGISVSLEELAEPSSYSVNGVSTAEGNEFDVSVDGGKTTVLAPQFGVGSYLLAGGLPVGSHSVVLRRRTEALIGVTRFRGFTVVGGKALTAPVKLAQDRRIEIIGDSISAGYGVLGGTSQCTYSPATQDEMQAYGYVAADNLQAEIHVNAWSGKGLSRNNDGSTTNTMPILYERTLPADSNSTWDFNQWVPQVVVVNLATNDFATGVPYAPAFQGAYNNLLAQLRQNYPQALIFCALGPMLTDSYPVGQNQLSTARTYIQNVVNNSLDPNVFFIEFPEQTSTTGCDFHPDVATQAAMGAQLSAAIAAKTGWTSLSQ